MEPTMPLTAPRRGAAFSRQLLLQQDRHRVVTEVRCGEIKFSIAIEIRRRDLVRVLPHRIRRARCLSKRPVALAKQESDGSISVVCGSQVEFPIVIEIPRYDGVRPASYQDCGMRPKRSIAISQQDYHGVA